MLSATETMRIGHMQILLPSLALLSALNFVESSLPTAIPKRRRALKSKQTVLDEADEVWVSSGGAAAASSSKHIGYNADGSRCFKGKKGTMMGMKMGKKMGTMMSTSSSSDTPTVSPTYAPTKTLMPSKSKGDSKSSKGMSSSSRGKSSSKNRNPENLPLCDSEEGFSSTTTPVTIDDSLGGIDCDAIGAGTGPTDGQSDSLVLYVRALNTLSAGQLQASLQQGAAPVIAQCSGGGRFLESGEGDITNVVITVENTPAQSDGE